MSRNSSKTLITIFGVILILFVLILFINSVILPAIFDSQIDQFENSDSSSKSNYSDEIDSLDELVDVEEDINKELQEELNSALNDEDFYEDKDLVQDELIKEEIIEDDVFVEAPDFNKGFWEDQRAFYEDL